MDFSYKTAPKEVIPCNFCGTEEYKVLARQDDEGLGCITTICKKCGLIFINPRMTKEGYAQYYQEEEYRTKESLTGHSHSNDVEKFFRQGIRHSARLYDSMGRYFKRGGTTLDVGSGAGGVLYGMKGFLDCTVLGIEPSVEAAKYANKWGVKTIAGLIEDIPLAHNDMPKFNNIICLQSINHFLDPKYFLLWAYENLAHDGTLVIEAINFRHQAKRAGRLENAIGIDHVYMFTPEVLEDFITSAGFDILFLDSDENKSGKIMAVAKEFKIKGITRAHVRVVARRSSRLPFEKITIRKDNYTQTLKSLNRFNLYMHCLLNDRLRRLKFSDFTWGKIKKF